MRRTLFTVLLVAAVVVGIPSTAQARSDDPLNRSISGVVTEASGAVVPNTSVKLLDLQRNQTSSILTNSSGRYGELHARSRQSRSGRLPDLGSNWQTRITLQ